MADEIAGFDWCRASCIRDAVAQLQRAGCGTGRQNDELLHRKIKCRKMRMAGGREVGGSQTMSKL